MIKITPLYLTLIMAFYNTSKAGDLESVEIGAEALTWYYISILQIIILLVYELLRRLTLRFTNRKL